MRVNSKGFRAALLLLLSGAFFAGLAVYSIAQEEKDEKDEKEEKNEKDAPGPIPDEPEKGDAAGGKKEKGAEGKKAGKKEAAGKDSAAQGKTSSNAKKSTEPTPEEFEQLKTRLKESIHGIVSFDADGTINIDYDLKQKKEDFQADFQPPISTKPQSNLRWSLYQEERTIGGDYGVRISDSGAAFLKVWFVDNVEATVEFLQGISWSKRQILALVFQAKDGKAIGNNYGGQCATFQSGKLTGGKPAETETTSFNSTVQIGLKVKDGNQEALRGGKSRTTAPYNRRNFASGRVGMIWSGSVTGTVTRLSVRGKIDYAAMVKELGKK